MVNFQKNEENEEDWSKCFLAKNTILCAKASVDFEKEWIVDSGCGHHVTGDQSKFAHLHDYEGRYSIVTADNTVHSVKKEGVVRINNDGDDSIMLQSVFHVLGLKKNLFSVSNAVDARNYVLFGLNDVKFL